MNTSRHTVGQVLYPESCWAQMVRPPLAQGWEDALGQCQGLGVSRWVLGSAKVLCFSSGVTGSL